MSLQISSAFAINSQMMMPRSWLYREANAIGAKIQENLNSVFPERNFQVIQCYDLDANKLIIKTALGTIELNENELPRDYPKPAAEKLLSQRFALLCTSKILKKSTEVLVQLAAFRFEFSESYKPILIILPTTQTGYELKMELSYELDQFLIEEENHVRVDLSRLNAIVKRVSLSLFLPPDQSEVSEVPLPPQIRMEGHTIYCITRKIRLPHQVILMSSAPLPMAATSHALSITRSWSAFL